MCTFHRNPQEPMNGQRHNNNGVVLEENTAMSRRATAPVEKTRSHRRTADSEDPGPSTPRMDNASSHTNAARPYSLSWNRSVSTHLEAYILRPQLEHKLSTINLSYMAEKLSLDSMKLEQHVDRLGPEHSIIDDVRNLRAEQYRQVDTILKQRNGKLVSVHRDTVEMSTSMGHMHATTLTFVLSTTKPEGQEPLNQSDLIDMAAATSIPSPSNIQASPVEATRPLAERPRSRKRLSRSPLSRHRDIQRISEGKKPVGSSERLQSSPTFEASAPLTTSRAKREIPSSDFGRTQSEYNRRTRDQTEGGQSELDQSKQDQVEYDQSEHERREPDNTKYDTKHGRSEHDRGEIDQTKHECSENEHSEPINTPANSQNSPLSERTISPMSGIRSETPTPKDHRIQNDTSQSKAEKMKIDLDEPNENRFDHGTCQSKTEETEIEQDESDKSRPDQGDPDDSLEKVQKQMPFEDIDNATIIRSKSETQSSKSRTRSTKGPEAQSELEDQLKQLHKSPNFETVTTSDSLKAKSEMPPPPAKRGGTPFPTNTQNKIRESTESENIADKQGPEKKTPVAWKSPPLFKAPPTPKLHKAEIATQLSFEKPEDCPVPTIPRKYLPQSSPFKNMTNELEPKKETYDAGKKSQLLKSHPIPIAPKVHSDTQQPPGKLEKSSTPMDMHDDAPQSSASIDTADKQKLGSEPTFSGKILLSDYFEAPQRPQTIPSGSKKKKNKKKKKKKISSTAKEPESPAQTRVSSPSSSDVSTLAGDDDATTYSIPEPFGIPSQNCKKCNAFLVVHSKQELELRECDLCRDFRDTECALCKEDFQKLEKQGGSAKDMERSADMHRAFISQCMAWSRQQRKTLDDWNAN